MVASGLLLNQYSAALSSWTVYLLGIQMLIIGLSVRISAICQALRRPYNLLLWVAFAWVLLPFFSFLLGRTFLQTNPGFAAGLVLTTSLPAAITANIWTGLSHGNLALSLTIVGATSVLSGVVTPLLLGAWVGVFVHLDSVNLLISFLYSVLAPTLLGIGVNEAVQTRLDPYRTLLKLLLKLIVGLVIFINAGVLHPHLAEWGWSAVNIFLLVIIQAVIIYALLLTVLRRIPRISTSDIIALTYTIGMRNNSAGIVIAMTYFGPVVAAPVILSVLMQQPLASLVHRFVLNRTRDGAAHDC